MCFEDAYVKQIMLAVVWIVFRCGVDVYLWYKRPPLTLQLLFCIEYMPQVPRYYAVESHYVR